jgi:putative nucleotidyltransferase with HDIG domain
MIRLLLRQYSKDMLNENDLQKQNWALLAHAKASSALVRSTNRDDLIEGVCNAIINQPPYVLAWVGLANHDPLKTVSVIGAHGAAAEYAKGIDIKWSTDTPEGQGPTGECIQSGLPVLINDVEKDPRFLPWRERARPYGIRSVIAVPIRDHDPQVLGALTVYANLPDAFGNTETVLFESLAKEIGFGLVGIEKQHQLDNEITQREQVHRQLVDSLHATIEAISRTMEWRDPYTAGHQKKVALLSEAIARKLGWDEEKIKGLYLAALVHDMGKIATPAEILTKPSQLSETEMTLIREHPNTGYEILKDVPFSWPIAEAVRQHHERLDGSGYPRGLKGDAIIPEARVLGIADTIEAMTSHRPYRPGLGLDKAIEQVKLEAGIRLDAQMSQAACELLEQDEFRKLMTSG